MSSFHCGLGFLPIIVFLATFLGGGAYFNYIGLENAFSLLSPVVAIIPAIITGIVLGRGELKAKLDDFINGMRSRDIIFMCIIFILAGAFGAVTKSIGSVESTVNMMLYIIPSEILLAGIFIISAFISTAMGTSMGVVAVMGPIAVHFAEIDHLDIFFTMGTVVGGAMFGDNLSLISDTTIASVNSVGADLRSKFKLNAKIAFISAMFVCVLLIWDGTDEMEIENTGFCIFKVLPYLLIIILAMYKVNVLVVLLIGILSACVIGIFTVPGYGIIAISQGIYTGIANMNEIMVLSLLVGGMTGVMQKQGAIDYIAHKIENLINRQKKNQKKKAELTIGIIAAINDICIANNTIAILLGGSIAKKLAKDYKIAKSRAACWLDIFSCVFQGILPYSAQILLASSIAGISPLSIVPYVYYCYVLLIVTVVFIVFGKR